ncbi:hypothetical protein JG688_00013663 [Phytophthora aleatoria]|uniref:RxLR effector protein n=1 Tax=Phytophthora aleatoria TaxID=2496075 RepID=A0A8J5ILW8_9STRA|nr:hypothetical protein JG688_00013663 [Phytophthora aleatoria]
MRFSVFVVLPVATFLVCCFSFASAEYFNGGRRLRAEDGKNGAAKAAVKAVQTSNANEVAIKREILAFAAAKEGAKMSDESVAKISKMLAEMRRRTPSRGPVSARSPRLSDSRWSSYLRKDTSTSTSTTTTTTGTPETGSM